MTDKDKAMQRALDTMRFERDMVRRQRDEWRALALHQLAELRKIRSQVEEQHREVDEGLARLQDYEVVHGEPTL